MKKSSIVLRAGLVLGVLSITVVGATFAALTSTATLTNNTISSATAALTVDGNGDDTFAASEAGFTFSGLVPGADYGTAQNFSLKNEGTADLHVTVYATVGTTTGTVDKSKVHVKFVNGADSAEYTLAQLEAVFNDVPGVSGLGSLAAAEENALTVAVKLDADAVTGGSATVAGFDLVFTGSSFVAAP